MTSRHRRAESGKPSDNFQNDIPGIEKYIYLSHKLELEHIPEAAICLTAGA